MPDFLKDWLDKLSAGPTDVLWDWLETNPNAVEEMIEVLYKNPT